MEIATIQAIGEYIVTPICVVVCFWALFARK